MTKPVEIEIKDSVIHGDVVAGDKNVVVHLHESQLDSLQAISAVLQQQGQSAAAADVLIQALLSDPELAERYETAKLSRDREQIEALIDTTLLEHQRSGITADAIAKLWEAINKSRKADDWLSFSRSATTLLELLHNSPTVGEKETHLADELIAVGRKDPKFAINIPVARIFQAAELFQRHAKGVIDLRTALMAASNIPGNVPLLNFHSSLRETIGYSVLSDQYARQALDFAFKSGDPSVAIYVLFAVITLQNHQYWLYRWYLAGDGHELAERIRRTLRVLDQLITVCGSENDRAMLHSNTAAFWLTTQEFEKAETLALAAARKFAALGNAFAAARAMNIAESARNKEPVLHAPPTDEDFDNIPIEEVVVAMRTGVATMGKLNGIDLEDPRIKAEVEAAFRDFTPERVLRFCDHITVDCEPSALALALTLNSLGRKTLTCRKFVKRLQAPDLESGFTEFKRGLGCDRCQHRSPRPDSWKWSPRWAEEDARERFRNGDAPVGNGYY